MNKHTVDISDTADKLDKNRNVCSHNAILSSAEHKNTTKQTAGHSSQGEEDGPLSWYGSEAPQGGE